MNQAAAPDAKKPEDDKKAPETQPGKIVDLTSIGMLVAPLLAAVGGLALTGTIGRVQRDYPKWISIAIGLVIFSGALWVIASNFASPAVGKEHRTIGLIFKSISVALAAFGFVLALVAAVNTAKNEPRPQITADVSADLTALKTHVAASSLATDDRLAFRIDLLRKGESRLSLYRAYVGPDSEGNVDQTITTRLPANGVKEIGIKAYTGKDSPRCDDFSAVRRNEVGSGTGCVIVTLPPKQEQDNPEPKPEPPPEPAPTGLGG